MKALTVKQVFATLIMMGWRQSQNGLTDRVRSPASWKSPCVLKSIHLKGTFKFFGDVGLPKGYVTGEDAIRLVTRRALNDI